MMPVALCFEPCVTLYILLYAAYPRIACVTQSLCNNSATCLVLDLCHPSTCVCFIHSLSFSLCHYTSPYIGTTPWVCCGNTGQHFSDGTSCLAQGRTSVSARCLSRSCTSSAWSSFRRASSAGMRACTAATLAYIAPQARSCPDVPWHAETYQAPLWKYLMVTSEYLGSTRAHEDSNHRQGSLQQLLWKGLFETELQ